MRRDPSPGEPVLLVGLDLSSEPAQGTGVAHYGRSLARALAADPSVRLVVFGSPAPELAELPLVRTPFAHGSYARRRAFQQLALPPLALAHRVDVLHSVNNLLPVAWPGVKVLTFQDAKLYHAAAGAPWTRRLYRRAFHRLCPRRADLVLVASRYSEQEAVGSLGVDPAKVRVVPFGVDAERFAALPERESADAAVLARHGLRAGGYVLNVATREPAKNLPRALEAFAQVARRVPEVSLALCGARGWEEEDLAARCRALQIVDRVRMLGYVAQDDLPALYRGSRAFLFPSLVEGFGLPILEAFAAGTPVVTSTTSACPETAGGAALLADPYDVEAIAAALERAVSDEEARADLVARGQARARELSWARTARSTVEAYRQALRARVR